MKLFAASLQRTSRKLLAHQYPTDLHHVRLKGSLTPSLNSPSMCRLELWLRVLSKGLLAVWAQFLLMSLLKFEAAYLQWMGLLKLSGQF